MRPLPPAGPRGLDLLPPLENGAAGGSRRRAGRFLGGAAHPARRGLPGAAGRLAVLHHRVLLHRGADRTPGGLHPREPPHPALPGHARRRAGHRAAAELGCPAAGVVPQPGDRRPGPAPGDHPGPALEQELFRLPCERPGQGIPPGGGPLRHHLARLRHHLRALSRTRQPPCGQVQEPGGVRRGSRAPHRPADPPRPRAELDGLRPVPLLPRPDGLRLRRRGRLLRLLLPAARIHAGTLRGPDLVPPTARPAVSRRTRSASGRASASCSGGRPAPAATPTPTVPTSSGTNSSSRRTTPSAPAATKRSGRTSPPTPSTPGTPPGAPASSATCRAASPASGRRCAITASRSPHRRIPPVSGSRTPATSATRGRTRSGRRHAWTSGGETPRAGGRSSAARRPTRGLGS